MKKRYQTYFGVPIPPFKEDKLAPGSVTIRFILTGKIPSKKNNQMSVAVRKFARDWSLKQQKSGTVPTWKIVHQAISKCKSKVRPNQEYKEWVDRMKPVLHAQSA